MSESIVRKVQPFTIGTKLSAPAVPKCSDLVPDGYLPNRTFSDNCKLRHLNEQVSLYLGRCGPATIPTKHPREDDRLNRNAVSPNAASRSIRKITISSRMEAAKDRLTPGMEQKKIRTNSENINNNNNNITTSNTQLPKIVGVSCENKPNSHLKVRNALACAEMLAHIQNSVKKMCKNLLSFTNQMTIKSFEEEKYFELWIYLWRYINTYVFLYMYIYI